MSSILLKSSLINRSIALILPKYSIRISTVASSCIKSRSLLQSTKSMKSRFLSNYHQPSSVYIICRNLSTSLKSFEFNNKNPESKLIQFDQVQSDDKSLTVTNRFEAHDEKELVDIADLDKMNSLIDTTNQLIQNMTISNQILTATDIGLSPFLLPRLFYDFLNLVHIHSSFNWVVSIGLTCLFMRILAFPLYIESKRSSIEFFDRTVRMSNTLNEFNTADKLSNQELFKKSTETMKTVNDYVSYMPRAILSPIIQGIIFSSFYFCLRAMAQHPIESMQQESFLWVPSLVMKDPYCLFPLLTSITLFSMLRFNMEMNINADTKILKYMTYGLPLLTFAITSQMPANLTIYWFINNNITVSLFFLLKQPSIKKYFGLRDIKMESMKAPDPDFHQNFQSSIERIRTLHEMKERQELEAKLEQSQTKFESIRPSSEEEITKRLEELKKMLEDLNKKKGK